MKLLNYMYEKSLTASKIDNEDKFEEFVGNIDNEIRDAINLNRGALNLPEDYEDVMDWLGGCPCTALCDIDIYEGGVFYYYLCRCGIC